MIEWLLSTGTQNRLFVITTIFIITILLGSGIPYLKVNTEVDALLSADNSTLLKYSEITDQFGSEELIVITVHSDKLWNNHSLQTLRELHSSFEQLSFVRQVSSLFKTKSLSIEKNHLKIDTPLNREITNQEQLAFVKEQILNNKLTKNNLISPDGNTTVMLLHLDKTTNLTDKHIYAEVENIISQNRQQFKRIFQLGSPSINIAIQESMQADLIYLAPIAVLVIIVSIVIFLHSFLAAALPLITATIAIIWTFGSMGWLGIQLNSLTGMLPTLILVIGATEIIHIYSSYLYHTKHNHQLEIKGIILRMMRHIGIPILFTIITTVIGFASNIPQAGMIGEFAIGATIAMFSNGIIIILLVPTILVTFAKKSNKISLYNRPSWNFVYQVIIKVQHYPKTILITVLTVVSLAGYHANKIHVTNDPFSYLQSDSPVITKANFVHEQVAGVKSFFITLQTEEKFAFKQPKNLRLILKIEEFLKQQGVYDNSTSIAKILSWHYAKLQGMATSKNIEPPYSKAAVEQLLLLFQQHEFNSYVNHNFSQANIIVRHNISDSHILNQYISELESEINRIVEDNMEAHITGKNLMINRAAESLTENQLHSLTILIVVTFVLMSFIFTSIKGGVISLVPNIVPILLIFGVMGFMNIPLHPGTAMVAVISVGVAIDDTIHLLTRYNDETRLTISREEAVANTLHQEFLPIIVTTITLVLGFAILSISEFNIVSQFGTLAAITMVFALLSDLILTPMLMSKTRLVSLARMMSLKVNREILQKSPLFDGMTNYQIRKAILMSAYRNLDKGEVLIKQGTKERSMYLILNGKLQVINRQKGHEQHITTLTTGEVVGEIGFVGETLRTADVVAECDTELLVLDYQKLQNSLRLFPAITAKINLNISRILGERLAKETLNRY